MRTAGALSGPSLRSRRFGDAPGWSSALLARLRCTTLDRELAAGLAPWTSRVHAARSLQLTARPRREQIARLLQRLIQEAERPRRPFSAAVPPCRAQVREAEPAIRSLTARLLDGRPISSRGVAALCVLLSDGGGPCYLNTHPWALADALDRAAADLETPTS